jgi:hypothetical protein
MKFRTPLRERQRFARNKRDRYLRDPNYRLGQINAVRERRGLPPYRSLDEVKLRRLEA